MNLRSIAQLAQADLSLNRRSALFYAAAAIAGASMAGGSTGWLQSTGASLVLCVLIGMCFHLPIVSVFQDVARGTRTFTLSLPVTPCEYAAGKLAANAALFLLPAGAAAAAALATPESSRAFPPSLVLLGMLGGLIVFVQNLGIALVTGSMGASMTVLVGQLFVLGNILPRVGPRVPGWFTLWGELHTGGPWLAVAFGLFFLELAATTALVLYLMSRKRRFV